MKPKQSSCLLIMEDWHAERIGFFRAYTAENPNAETCCPLIGYASSGGSHKTIKAVVREAITRCGWQGPIFRAYHTAQASKLIKT